MSPPRHKFIRPGNLVLNDTETGERLVPAAAFLAYARQRDATITEPQLIKRMEAVGWTWKRQTATDPDTGDTLTTDFYVVPSGWAPTTHEQEGAP
jgi:hypothetical protein